MSMTGWEAVLVMPVSPDRDHIRGPLDAPVSVVEYGDYECPFCGAAHPIIDAIQTQLGDLMQFVFRHFPMSTVHPHAMQAAEAAEAAGARGRFWPMHDLLFANQPRFEIPHLLTYARAVGLDPEAVAIELAQHVHQPKVREDFMSGVRSGVNGTPTFFINGVRYDASWDLDPLMIAIQRAATSKSGVQ
jgi:protein-disulfide isomerase